jgi:hypothetical protein
VQHPLEADRAPRPRSRVLQKEALLQQSGHVSDVGLVASLISKMRSSLSKRGTIRRWWRLARIKAAPNPAFTRLCSVSVSYSNHC